jgi:hypothetical protein
MSTLLVDTEQLKQIIRESVKEAIKSERLFFYNSIVPEISDDEMIEITEQLGAKPKKQAYSDYSQWFDDEN